MRNTVEYPITKEEIIACLDEFAEQVDRANSHLCGDMRPLLLAKAKEIILNATQTTPL